MILVFILVVLIAAVPVAMFCDSISKERNAGKSPRPDYRQSNRTQRTIRAPISSMAVCSNSKNKLLLGKPEGAQSAAIAQAVTRLLLEGFLGKLAGELRLQLRNACVVVAGPQ